MKAAIMTFSLSQNFGAQLQTYALSKVLNENGINAEVFNYFDENRITFGMSLFSKLKYRVWRIVRSVVCGNEKEKSFELFREKYIPLTAKRYHLNRELREDSGDYDVYIAGSDQIWNPDIFKYDLSYFLDFVPEGKKKISYAASFGKRSFESPYADKCGEILGGFFHISVRENSGAAIVERLCGKTPVVDLDPTLLLGKDEWSRIAGAASERARSFRGILCYVMPGDKVVTDKIESVAQALAEKLSLPIMRLGIKETERWRFGKDGCDITASPADFVAYIMNARYVVTNSFHGTAFSVNFDRQVIVPYNDKLPKEKALHERIESFLGLVDYPDAFLPCSKEFDFVPERDVKATAAILAQRREESLRRLLSSVGGSEND